MPLVLCCTKPLYVIVQTRQFIFSLHTQTYLHMDFQHPAENSTSPLEQSAEHEHHTAQHVSIKPTITLEARARQILQDKVNYRHTLDLLLNEGALNGEKVYHFTGRDGYGKEVAWVLLNSEGVEVASFVHMNTPTPTATPTVETETPAVIEVSAAVVDESVPQATAEVPTHVEVALPTQTDEALPPADSAEALHEENAASAEPAQVHVHITVVQSENATDMPEVNVDVQLPETTIEVDVENQQVEVEINTPHMEVEVEAENQQVEVEIETPHMEVEVEAENQQVEVEIETPKATIIVDVDMSQDVDMTEPMFDDDLFMYEDTLNEDYPHLGAIIEEEHPSPNASTQPVVVTLDAVGMEDIRLELNMETEYLYETMHSKLLRCRLYIFNPFHQIVFQQITLQNTEIRNLQNECAENAQLKLLVDKSRTVFDLQPQQRAVLDFVAVLPPNTTENYLFYVRFTVNVLMPVNTEGSASFPIEY